ncbi:hypothetical protein MXB_274 [Myxobolus squamalis]|nr:hypothetical protein MXB_274 [Myxobolus squamalis]
MAPQKKLSAYYSTKKVPINSPLKKKKTRDVFTPKAKFLSLRELFSMAPQANKKNAEFLSSGQSEIFDNDLNPVILPQLNISTPNALIQQIADEKIKDLNFETPNALLSTPFSVNTDKLSFDISNESPVKKSRRSPNIQIEASRRQLFFSHPGIVKNKKAEPAYKRFAPLCKARAEFIEDSGHDIHISTSFYLPTKYQRLYDMFVAVDAVLLVFKNRNEVCDFKKLKTSVQYMTKMVFNEIYFSQIIHLLPEAFKLYIGDPPSQSPGPKSSKLLIELNDFPVIEGILTNQYVLGPYRRNAFHDLLMSETKRHHQNFLFGLGVDIDDSLLKRWHPRFAIQEIPDIQMAILPQPESPKTYSAKDMLQLTCFNDDPKMISALNAAMKSSLVPEQHSILSEEILPRKNDSKILKNVPKSFLERIREKEKINSHKMMMRDPNKDILFTKMERLPDIMRCVYNYFVSEKKPYLQLDSVCEKVKHSCLPDLTLDQIQEHVLLIQHHIPEWLEIVNLHEERYVGIKNTKYNINDAVTIIKECICKLKLV